MIEKYGHHAPFLWLDNPFLHIVMVIVVDKDICLFRKRPKEFFFILLEESLEKWRQGWENMSPPIQTDLDYSSWLTAASLPILDPASLFDLFALLPFRVPLLLNIAACSL